MKKVFFALALMTFVGSIATTAYAASNGVSTEIKKDDKKKKKKKELVVLLKKELLLELAQNQVKEKLVALKNNNSF